MKKLITFFCFLVLNYLQSSGQMCPITTGTNLVTNGNFQSGCTSFTSEYNFNGSCNGGSVGPGNWTVTNNANARNGFFTNPTGANPPGEPAGAGNQYLIIDADGTLGKDAYRSTVNVLNGTTYFFSAWISNINGTFENPPELQFSINGVQLGANLIASSTTHDWQQFYVTWTSTITGPVDIRLENLITTSNGNDLAIDAINFNTSCANIPNVSTLGQSSVLPDTVYNCNIAFPLNLNPGLPGTYNYAWKKVVGTTLSTATTYNEPPTPADGTKLFLCYEFIPGCPRKDSVIFKITPITIKLGPDRVRCLPINELLSSGLATPPVSIQWQRNSVNIVGATNTTYTAVLPGTYTINATRAGCAAGSDNIVISSPAAGFSGSGNFCVSTNTADFTVTGAAQVKWYTVASGGVPLNPGNTNPTISLTQTATNTTTPGCTSGLYAQDISSFNGVVGPATAPCGSGGGDENGNRSPMQFTVNRNLILNTVDILQPGFGYAGTANYIVRIYANNPTGGPYSGGCGCNLPGPGTLLYTSATTSYPLPAVQTQRSINVAYSFTGIVAPTDYWLVVEENNGTRFQNCAGAFPYSDNSGQNAITINKSLKDNGVTTAYGHAFNWNFTAGNVFSCGRLFICAVDNCAAPVDLISFNVKKQANGNMLIWETASEKNSAYFILQRSIDGINFEDIRQVSAAGNSSSNLSYAYLDSNYPSDANVVYYRLKQIDIDASAHYSTIKAVQKQEFFQEISLYPIPVK